MNNIGKHILIFLGYLLLQTLFSRFVDFGPLIFIAIYPLYIITLDTKTPLNSLFILAFAMGILVDIFSGQIIGLNSAATLVMALFIPIVLKPAMAHKTESDNFRPGLNTLGFSKFIVCLLILLAIHHVSYSLIESFSISFFIYNLPRMLVSYLVNILLITIIEYGINYTRRR